MEVVIVEEETEVLAAEDLLLATSATDVTEPVTGLGIALRNAAEATAEIETETKAAASSAEIEAINREIAVEVETVVVVVVQEADLEVVTRVEATILMIPAAVVEIATAAVVADITDVAQAEATPQKAVVAAETTEAETETWQTIVEAHATIADLQTAEYKAQLAPGTMLVKAEDVLQMNVVLPVVLTAPIDLFQRALAANKEDQDLEKTHALEHLQADAAP